MSKNEGEKFGADYFERGEALGLSCYTDYRWLPELTIPLAHRLVMELDIGWDDVILDYGCAKGYLVKALRMLGHEAWGVDISHYALSAAPEDVRAFLGQPAAMLSMHRHYDMTIAKDVFEHVDPIALLSVLTSIRKSTKRMYAIVPLGDGHRFYSPDYERDKTHLIRQDENWWATQFKKANFSVEHVDLKREHIKKTRRGCGEALPSDGFFVLS